MKNRRTLKARIIRPYTYLAIFLGIIVYAMHSTIVFRALKNQDREYRALIESSFKKNLVLAAQTHNKYIENLMLSETRNLADSLASLAISDEIEINKVMDDILLSYKATRKSIFSRFAIINLAGVFLFDSEGKLPPGKNYKTFKKEFPELYVFMKAALTKKELFGNLECQKPITAKLTNRYIASVRIPETSLFVFTDHHQSAFNKKLYSTLTEEKENNFKILYKKAEGDCWNSIFRAAIWTLLILFVFVAATYWIGSKIAEKISSPLVQVQRCLKKYGKGHFHAEIPESGSIETANLVKAFNKLGKNLNIYMNKLKDEITTRNTIENEIKVAKNIQNSIIPHVTGEFDNTIFSLYSKLIPAKEVAGDFYDFFFLDEEKTKLAFLIADVSGKGIPAAFFMCILKTITKIFCLTAGIKPEEVLKKTNQFICKDNAEYMFATMFLGFYDLKTGDFNYANAGHHPTIYITKNRGIEEFGLLKNTVLGFYPEHKYNSGYKHIQNGEKLVLFTDGITEAESSDGKEYGLERLYKILSKNIEASPKDICEITIEDVCRFQSNILFDDITILVFHRK